MLVYGLSVKRLGKTCWSKLLVSIWSNSCVWYIIGGIEVVIVVGGVVGYLWEEHFFLLLPFLPCGESFSYSFYFMAW